MDKRVISTAHLRALADKIDALGQLDLGNRFLICGAIASVERVVRFAQYERTLERMALK